MRADDGSVISARLMELIDILLEDGFSAPNAKDWHEAGPMIARNKAVGFIPIHEIYVMSYLTFPCLTTDDDVRRYVR